MLFWSLAEMYVQMQPNIVLMQRVCFVSCGAVREKRFTFFLLGCVLVEAKGQGWMELMQRG